MKINKVVFKNFKSYVNETVFDFSGEKHINIISGENGNGKTSFLEGISLAFFGCKIFGSDVYTSDFITFVTSRLSDDSDSNEFYIKVDYIDEGNEYSLSRRYVVVGNKIEEEFFEILSNGIVVESSKFLDKYDYSIMRQLFLDGEVITRVIEDDKIDPFIQGFINTAFNIKLFDQISKDLDLLEKREFSKIQTNEHKILEKNVGKLVEKKNNVEKHIRKNDELIQNFNQQLKIMKKNLDKRGIEVGSVLQKLMDNNEVISQEIKAIEHDVKDFLIGNVHYLLHKGILNKVVEELNGSRSVRVNKVQEFYKSLDSGESVFIDDNYISLKLESFIVNKTNYVNNCDLDKEKDLIRQLRKNNKKFLSNKSKIIKTNEGKGRLDDLGEYENILQDVEELMIEKESLLIERENLENELMLKQKELEKCSDKIMSQRIDNNLDIEKNKLKNIVDKYARVKTNSFNEEVAMMSFSILSNHFLRKKGLVDKVCLKGGFLSVYKDDREVNFKNFSAGEKQMLVVSILFAIIEVAKLDIPLVLDSFVGRLDIGNTSSALKYVRDNIKTQVIMLSTDSEVNKDDLSFLSEKLGKSYILKNDAYSTFIERIEV